MTDEGREQTAVEQQGGGAAQQRPQARDVRRARWVDWAFYPLLAAASVGLLYVASLPGAPLLWLLPLLGLWLIVGLFWLVRLALAIHQRSLNASLLIAPVTVLVMGALFMSSWPLQARFDLSRSSFDEVVRSLPAGQSEGGGLGLVGTYRIKHWVRTADGVRFYAASGTGLVDDAGFAYAPDGLPESLTNSADPGFEVMGWQDLGDGWYSWQASW